MLARAWGAAHALPEELKYYVYIPLAKTTRLFSYSDEKVHKLYSSSKAKLKVKRFLEGNWRQSFFSHLEREMASLIEKLRIYQQLGPRPVEHTIKAAVDTLECELEHDVDMFITSPPYLQAQEYLRSTKLELFWMGYEEEEIRRLSKLELPYRQVEKSEIRTTTFWKFRSQIREQHLISLYDNYFHSILSVFERLSKRVTKYMCIFVGPATVRTVSIPIDKVVVEHMVSRGWEHQCTYIDKIVGRVMFESRVNPAYGLEDKRIPTERLVVLHRK